MKLRKIVDYLIKEGNVHIEHLKWYDFYTWSERRDGYDVAFEIEVIKQKGRSDKQIKHLILTKLSGECPTAVCDLENGDVDWMIGQIEESGVLDGCC